MSSFPSMARTVTGSGQVRYRLGERLVDRYLEFVAPRCPELGKRPLACKARTAGVAGWRWARPGVASSCGNAGWA